VVVDDHFMHVTTAVRGEAWISSTPKHVLLYDAFGWQMPRTIHTPLLRDADRRKLSKRTGDTSIGWFRLQGYLPDGFRNFITHLIWTHPDGKDIYSWPEFVCSTPTSSHRRTATSS
jgi:glutamyl/glutaminyl-tRNA synthetase